MKNEPLQSELRELLSRLPDAPVPSNFTARVMQTVELEEVRRAGKWNFTAWNWRPLLPRVAFAAIVVCSGLTFYQHEIYSHRAELAKNLQLVAQAQPPSVEALQNFDAIRRMSQPAHADAELLALAPDLK